MSETDDKLASFLILEHSCISLSHFNRILILKHFSNMSINDIMNICEQTDYTYLDPGLFKDHVWLYLSLKRSTCKVVIGAHNRNLKI